MALKIADESADFRHDTLKWLVVWALLVAAVVANIYFSQVPLAIRVAVGLVLLGFMLVIVLQTKKGHRAGVFIKGARLEMRKVVWPTRQETIQTTLVVAAMVVVMAMLLWGIDSLFLWAVSWLTGRS
jgi:preprotein translocase subunit SecE